MEWISVDDEEPLCSPYVRHYLLCDMHGNVYMGFRDDHDMKYYSIDAVLTELISITHFMEVPKPPIKDGVITHDDCLLPLLQEWDKRHGMD